MEMVISGFGYLQGALVGGKGRVLVAAEIDRYLVEFDGLGNQFGLAHVEGRRLEDDAITGRVYFRRKKCDAIDRSYLSTLSCTL